MRFVALASVLEALFLWLRWLNHLSAFAVETIGTMLLAGATYLVACYLVLKHSHISRSGLRIWIVAAAAAFRLTVWPLAPTLSDDPFRYRWEGQLQAAGGNPYQTRPNDPEWQHLRDSAFPKVVGRDFKAVYGPLLEQMELWTYRAVSIFETDPVRQVFWFKLPFALLDLGVIAALWTWLRARGVPVERVLLYAWCPLPVLEFWATGHNDSFPILFTALAFMAAARERWTWSFAALSLAGAAKLWPLLLFPVFIGWTNGRPARWFQWWITVPIMGLLAMPYWSDVWENARVLTGFLGGWRNNDSLFGILLWAATDIYLAKKIAFGIVGGTVLFVTLLGLPLERAALWILTVTLMVASNCHPWYLTWILPLLAFTPVPALLLWTTLIPLAYASVINWSILGEWHGSGEFRWLQYLPVYGLLAGSWIVGRYRHLRCRMPAKMAQ